MVTCVFAGLGNTASFAPVAVVAWMLSSEPLPALAKSVAVVKLSDAVKALFASMPLVPLSTA